MPVKGLDTAQQLVVVPAVDQHLCAQASTMAGVDFF